MIKLSLTNMTGVSKKTTFVKTLGTDKQPVCVLNSDFDRIFAGLPYIPAMSICIALYVSIVLDTD